MLYRVPSTFLAQFHRESYCYLEHFIVSFVQSSISRSSHQRCSLKKGFLKSFFIFTGKHLCQSLFFTKVEGLRPVTLLKKRLWHRCFLVNLAKSLRTALGDCFCISKSQLNSCVSTERFCNRFCIHFWYVFPYYNPWKYPKKIRGFLVLSGVWN